MTQVENSARTLSELDSMSIEQAQTLSFAERDALFRRPARRYAR